MFASNLALALAAFTGSTTNTDEVIPFADLGGAFEEKHCADGADCSLQDVIERSFQRIPLGVYELCYPTDRLKDRENVKDLQDICNALLRQQAAWIEWLATDPAAIDEANAEVAKLKDWVKGWRAARLQRLAKDGPGNFHEIVESSAEATAALEKITSLMHDGDKLSLFPRDGRTVQIMCGPTRRDFMEIVGYSGKHDDALKTAYWVDGVDQWTQIWVDLTLIVALEYAPWSELDVEFKTGLSMKQFDDTGLTEHVVEQATLALFHYCLLRHQRDQTHFEKAVAMNMAIRVCGQINTVDGEGGISTSGAMTRPYSRFVPGGNSNGGTLPALSAAPFNTVQENQWRKGHGSDNFASPLRKGQKAGAKRAKKDKKNPLARDKYAHFLLQEGAEKYVVTAPFFGPNADDKEYPPQTVINDYRQFFRAYKAGFFAWLEQTSVESREEGRDKFRQLIAALATFDETHKIDAAVEQIYGLPISAADSSTDSLEWRYLTWLGKGK